MKTTKDIYTDQRFRYNEQVTVDTRLFSYPANTVSRITSRTNVYLAPDRLLPDVFTRLNPQQLFNVGDRVVYRVWPFGDPLDTMPGIVTAVLQPGDEAIDGYRRDQVTYVVEYDHVEYPRYRPTQYGNVDLMLAPEQRERVSA